MLRLRRLASIVVLAAALATPASASERRDSNPVWDGLLNLWNRLESSIRWDRGEARGSGTQLSQPTNALAPSENPRYPKGATDATSEIGLTIDPSGNS
jgi:hypothetical protein